MKRPAYGVWPGRELIVLMGAPGSGKSTYAQRYPEWVTTDSLRTLKASGQEVTDAVVSAVYKRAFDRIVLALKANRRVVLDTPATNQAVRRRALSVAGAFHAAARLVVFTTDVEVCVRRQQERTDPVPEEIVRQIHAAITAQRSVVQREGWTSVGYVNATGRRYSHGISLPIPTVPGPYCHYPPA